MNLSSILSLVLPEQAGAHVLIPQTRVGLHITPTAVFATRLYAKGTQRTIQEFRSAPHAVRADGAEALGTVLKELLAGWSYTSVAVTISTPQVIYKRIRLPFNDREKILQVVPFELEGQLPFASEETQLDVLVLNKTETDEYEILVAAIHQSVLDIYRTACAHAGFTPDRITPDVFELAALCHHMQAKHPALIVLAAYDYAVSVMSIYEGHIHAVRTLDIPLSQGTSVLPEASLQKIRYTLPLLMREDRERITQAFAVGQDEDVGLLCEALAHEGSLSCIHGQLHKLFGNSLNFAADISTIRSAFVVSAVSAFGFMETQNISLDRDAARQQQETERIRQVYAGVLITGIFLATVAGGVYRSVYRLRKEFKASSQQLLNTLTTTFGISKRSGGRSLMGVVNNALDDARNRLETAEKIWFSLSTQNRFSFLSYLETLSTTLDKKALGLQLKRLALRAGPGNNADTLILEGAVPNFDAVRTFEESLRTTHLFAEVPVLQEPTFTINLTIPPRTDQENAYV